MSPVDVSVYTMSVTMATLRENGYNGRHQKNRRNIAPWSFARWQHPAMRRGARFALFLTLYLVLQGK